jgi:peptidoglycan/LPS O-acetylase OafA/YrhL
LDNGEPRCAESAIGPADQRPAQIPALTSIRFLLAMCVLCLHYHDSFPSLLSYPSEVICLGSTVAVPAFFCLSGFVLTYQYQHVDLMQNKQAYFIARAARVLPTYWFALLLVLALMPLSYLGENTKFFFPILLSHVFLLQSWIPNNQIRFGFNPPAHSLSVEAFFYVLFPTLLSFIKKRRWFLIALIPLVASLLFEFVDRLVPSPTSSILYPLSFLYQFVLGTIVATLFLRWRQAIVRSGVLTFGFASLLEIATLAATAHLSLYGVPPSMCTFAALLFVLAFRKGIVSRILDLPIFVTLGGMSYAVYMLHFVFIKAILLNEIQQEPVCGIAPFFLFTSLTLAASYVVYRWLEQPCRRWINSLGMQTRNKSSLNPAWQALFLALSACAVGRLLADEPWVQSAYAMAMESTARPVTDSGSVAFGESVRLLKMYILPWSDGRLVVSDWSAGPQPEKAPNVGVHLLDKDSQIVGQCDHKLLPRSIRTNQVWRDEFYISHHQLKNVVRIGFLVYDDPNVTPLVTGGHCDWGNHRLLIPLK